MSKPANITYGVDERPPFWMSLLLGFQHVCIYAIALVFPVIIVREIGGTPSQANFLVSMSMLAGGIGVILQALPRGPIGSGYLCPQVSGPSYVSASILAAQTGGIPLMLGMTAVAGLVESALSRVMHRLRALFPPEVTGLIVAMVGITVIRIAVSNFFGMDDGESGLELRELAVSALTLGSMIGLNIWSRGQLRLFCILIGMAIGYAASFFLGVLTAQDWAQVSRAAMLAFPLSEHPGWSFDFRLVLPLAVAAMCSTLKSVGDITTCQKINDADWKRTDMQNVRKGILADGLGCLSAGLFGGMGQSTSSSNVGLSIATGATSRIIGYCAGGLLILLAFVPKLAAVFTIMPAPVMGATLIFALSFMVVAGFQIVMSRMLDARKTFVIGISVIFGVSVDMLPNIYGGFHPVVQPVFSSALSAAAVMAVLLNLLFRIGIKKKARLVLAKDDDAGETVWRFIQECGESWGARSEIIQKVTGAVTEFIEAARGFDLVSGELEIEAAFDELSITVDIDYTGSAMMFPAAPPSHESLVTDGDAQLRLAGFLIGKYVDEVKTSASDGRHRVAFRVSH